MTGVERLPAAFRAAGREGLGAADAALVPPLPDGVNVAELSELLRLLIHSGHALGMTVARDLVAALVAGLAPTLAPIPAIISDNP